jgi:hypothetical protein
LESSTALIQAASGLERLMVGARPGPIKDSNVAQISAFIYYQANVIAKMTNNKSFQNKFTKTIFDQINKDFGEYIDAKSRTSSRSLHHVYEWKKVGDPSGRLFKLNKVSQDGLSFKLNYELMPSKSFVPTQRGKHRHVFKNKASVMEAGMPVKIAPRAAERIVFEIDGNVVFMPKGASVTVQRPGGSGVKNQFSLNYSRWFSSNLVNLSIKKSGFQNLFNQSLSKALKVPSEIKRVQYSFSPNSIRLQADAALTASFGGAL